MDFFINKIFNSKQDEMVHLQFQKFSRGEFKDRAIILAKQTGSKFSVNTTPEYGNELVRYLAEQLGNNKTKVTGVVVSTRDLEGELPFVDKKQFMGVKQYIIDGEFSGNEILNICDKFTSAFIGLSFLVNGTDLKIKPKAPKTAKPSTKAEEKPKADFCKVKTTDKELVKKLIFDSEAQSFKAIEIVHNFVISEIVAPDEFKKEKDFAIIRERSLRKGKIIRKLKIDGKDIVKEKEFSA